ncbi:MAG TPA: TetR family transcriptional regulator [Ktedonobacterales bacterium]|nr:TetR family transcriptional regulator [Ktedonobacterales bacterium]
MSTSDIIYNRGMSRWEPNALGRLEQAALNLYRERGFDQTTVTEIAARAGLTERSFYRYFADKREVLFWGQDRLRDLYVRTIAAAPVSVAPIDAVALALQAAVPVFHERRELARQRQVVVDANPGLQERELLKRAALAAAMAEALRGRGVPDPTASLAAGVGSLAFTTAFARWVRGSGELDLSRLISEALDQLKHVIADA